MNLDLHAFDELEKRQILVLKYLADEIEHKFQNRRAFDIDPQFLDRILRELLALRNITRKHKLLNKISKLEILITATVRYYIDSKYEEYFERVKAIEDKLYDLPTE